MKRLLRRMGRAALLHADTYEEVEADATATGQAMLVVILSALAAGVGTYRIIGLMGAVVTTLADGPTPAST